MPYPFTIPYPGGGGDGSRITELMLQRGDIQAAQAAQPSRWENTLAGLTQGIGLAGQALQMNEEQNAEMDRVREEARKDAAFISALRSGRMDPATVISIYGPERGLEVLNGLGEVTKLQEDVQSGEESRRQNALARLPQIARGLNALNEPMRAKGFNSLRRELDALGAFEGGTPEYSPELWRQLYPYTQQMGEQPGTREITTTDASGREITRIVPDVAGQEFVSEVDPREEELAQLELEGKRVGLETARANLAAAQRKLSEKAAQTGAAGDKDKAAAFAQARVVLEGLSRVMQRTQVGEGMSGKFFGSLRRAGAATGLDVDAEAHAAIIDGFTPILARAVGHTGVLTEIDVAQTKRLLPQLGDPDDIRRAKMTQLQGLMSLLERVNAGEKLTADDYNVMAYWGTGPRSEKQPKRWNPTNVDQLIASDLGVE